MSYKSACVGSFAPQRRPHVHVLCADLVVHCEMESLRFAKEGGEEENVISYCLYDLENGCISALKTNVTRFVEPFVAGYVWQRDAFSLLTSDEATPPWEAAVRETAFLWGSLRYGETVEEEWFVVSLLMAVTEELPDAAVRVWDNDGEFLLIEAAYALPKWIRPETSAQRVWLYRGKLHVIPRDYPASGGELTVGEALEVLKSGVETQARDSIQSKIQDRIGAFPKDTARTQHWAKCYVPVKVAQLLTEMRDVVSSVVRRFIDRGLAEMHALSRPVYVVPTEFVMCMVKFNRCSYAQLMQTEFYPPKNFPMLDAADPRFKAAELGMKLTCGVELLCRKLQNNEMADSVRESLESNVSAEEFSQRHVSFAEDDDSWLQDGEEDLEKELLKRESEQVKTTTQPAAYNPEDLVNSLGQFVDNVSSHEGAEAPPDVQFNVHRFVKELKDVMGDEFAEELDKLDNADSSEADSDLLTESISTYKTGSDGEPSHEVKTETDSDDDSDFREAYDSALDLELQETKMQESFIKKPDTTSGENEGVKNEVDLDMNLVENLLESYSEQHGLPGPVGNLAGLLNVKLPSGEATEGEVLREKTLS